MPDCANRIKYVKQPKNGYVPVSLFKTEQFGSDECILSKENVNPSDIIVVVNRLIKTAFGLPFDKAFFDSIAGLAIMESESSEQFDRVFLFLRTTSMSKLEAKGQGVLTDYHITTACDLVHRYDRYVSDHSDNKFNDSNTLAVLDLKNSIGRYDPDQDTIINIRNMVNRSVEFLKSMNSKVLLNVNFKDVWGEKDGYSDIVTLGEVDFMTKDTIWEIRASREELDIRVTLQLLMYWIMGQHSERPEFKCITKVGVFNPRLNKVYTLDIADIPDDVIKAVERDVICY